MDINNNFKYETTELIEGGMVYIDTYSVGDWWGNTDLQIYNTNVHVVFERIPDPYSFDEHWIFKKSGMDIIEHNFKLNEIISWLINPDELSDLQIKIIICTFNIIILKDCIIQNLKHFNFDVKDLLHKYPELLEVLI